MTTFLVADRFEANALLVKSEAATVYRGVDRQSGRAVALRAIEDRRWLWVPDSDPRSAPRRLQAVARAVDALQDPRIVPYLSADGWGVVTPFFDCPSLAALVNRRGPLDSASIVSIGRQVASALLEMHRLGHPHGEVRPGRIIVCDGGGSPRALLAYYGLETAMAQVHVPVYLPPGHALLSTYVPAWDTDRKRWDIWSLGLTLAEAAIGARLGVARVVPETLALPDQLRASPLGNVLQRAVSVEDPYQDIGELLEALGRLSP